MSIAPAILMDLLKFNKMLATLRSQNEGTNYR
jgi:hypothetical protein